MNLNLTLCLLSLKFSLTPIVAIQNIYLYKAPLVVNIKNMVKQNTKSGPKPNSQELGTGRIFKRKRYNQKEMIKQARKLARMIFRNNENAEIVSITCMDNRKDKKNDFGFKIRGVSLRREDIIKEKK